MGRRTKDAAPAGELARLADLRERFLEGGSGPDYWCDGSLVELYDRTFGERIRWKWAWVLAEAERRAPRLSAPGARRILDLGCGSAVATRAFLDRFPPRPGDSITLWDRSAAALEVATRLVQHEHGTLDVRASTSPPAAQPPADVVLVSHLLAELGRDARADVAARARTAGCVLVVEPGSRAASQAVVELREALLPTHEPLAPCPHGAPCPMRQRRDDWCHAFAPPAPEAFTEARWRAFSEAFGIDLRSLPVSYLVLEQRPVPERGGGLARLLGRAKVEKGRARLDLCTRSGLERPDLLQRTDRSFFKRLSSGRPFNPLLELECRDGRIASLRTVD